MKTPKEKAKEILDKYKHLCSFYEYETGEWEDNLKEQKQCALICADELIELASKSSAMEYYERDTMKYLKEVKKEIELC